MPAAKPTQPPAADMSVLIKRVDELSQKAGLGPIPPGAQKLPMWKRWLGGEKPEFDGSGLRDVVQTNAVFLDAVKRDLDDSKENIGVGMVSLDRRLDALEAQIGNPPFPG
jgi:hypothetical protein